MQAASSMPKDLTEEQLNADLEAMMVRPQSLSTVPSPVSRPQPKPSSSPLRRTK